MAVVLFGAVVFWLGRRSALESASAEAHAWAVATAQATATATALAGVQVNLNMDRGTVELTDSTGLHRRELPVSPGRELPYSPGAFPIAASNPARGGTVNPPVYETFAHQARSASQDHMVSRGVDSDGDADSVGARDGTGLPHESRWPLTRDREHTDHVT